MTAGANPIVTNAGRGGNNPRNLLARMDADVLAHQPDLVIVGVGTNDAINSKNSVPLPEFEKNCTTLIQKIRAAGAEAVFIEPPPCFDPFVLKRHSAAFFQDGSPSEKIRAYRAALRSVCEREHVPVVAVYETFLNKGSIGESKDSWLQNPENSGRSDGVHPTAKGNQAIADLVAQCLAENGWSTREHIVCFGDSITFGAGVKGGGTVEGDCYPARLKQILSAPAAIHPSL